MKKRSDYAKYTPELLKKLKKITDGLPRADGVKAIGKFLKLSPRQSRAVYSNFIDNKLLKEIAKPAKKEVIIEEPRKIKRLIWDIEVSPNIGFFWTAGFKLNIPEHSIIQERKIICIGYKWEDDPETHILVWDKNQDDKKMLEEFLKISEQADEMIHQNGDMFDLPWFRTRCLYHGLPPPPDYKTCDTLQWARRKFYFNSNKLDYIAKFLGLGGKIHTDFSLWKDITLNNCPIALAKMCDYCKKDVVLLEKVWKRLREFVTPKTHAGVIQGNESWTCPRTGSTNVKISKTVVTAGGVRKYQMKNLDTGSFYTISASAHAKYLEDKKAK